MTVRLILYLFTFLLSATLSFSAYQYHGLPQTGRCSQEDFVRVEGRPLADPSALPVTQLVEQDVKVTTTSASAVMLQWTNAYAELGSDALTNINNTHGGVNFFYAFHCDTASTDATHWSTVSAQSVPYLTGVVTLKDAVNQTFQIPLSGLPAHRHRFLVVSVLPDRVTTGSLGDGSFRVLTWDERYARAIPLYDKSDNSISRTWSDVYAVEADLTPIQQLDIRYPALSETQTEIPAQTLLTDGGLSVNQTFYSTIDARLTSSPVYLWTKKLKLNGNEYNVPSLIYQANTGRTEFSVTGMIGTTNMDPGLYNLELSLEETQSKGQVSRSFSWLIKPPAAAINVADQSNVGSVEIASEQYRHDITLPFSRTGGLSTGVSAMQTYVDLRWSISDIEPSTWGIEIDQLTKFSDAGTNNVSFKLTGPDDDVNKTGTLTFKLKMDEVCKATAPSYCSQLRAIVENTYKISVVGHGFNFSPQNREDEKQYLSDTADYAKFLPFWIDSTDTSRANRLNYEFQAQNIKNASGSSVANPANLFQVTGFNVNGANQLGAILGGGSVHGMSFVTQSAGISAWLTKTGPLTINDRFEMELQASHSYDGTAHTTSIKLGFIVQESKKPSVITSGLRISGSGSAGYSWGVSVPLDLSGNVPWPAQAEAEFFVGFDETVMNPEYRFDVTSKALGGPYTTMSQGVAGSMMSTSISISDFTSFIGTDRQIQLEVNVQAARDQYNVVSGNRNTMNPSVSRFMIVTTPWMVSYDAGTVTTPMPRGGVATVKFSEPLAGSFADWKRSISSTGLTSYIVQKEAGGATLKIAPVPGLPLAAAGSNTASLSFRPAFARGESGYPNITTQTVQFRFKPDTTAPILLSGLEPELKNSYRTSLSWNLLFDENLNSGTARLFDVASESLLPLSGVQISGRSMSLETSSLAEGREYRLVVEVADGSSNSATYRLPSVFTLKSDDAQVAEDLQLLNTYQNQERVPFVQNVFPDFRLRANQSNVPQHPRITLVFSEPMQASVTRSILLSDNLALAATMDSSVVDYFDGKKMSFVPELKQGTSYSFTLASSLAKSTAGTSIKPFQFNFTTYDPNLSGNQAPVLLGNNIQSKMQKDRPIRFFFNELILPESLLEAVEIRNSSGQAVNGRFTLEGTSALFYTDSFVEGSSYSCTIYTSRVQDLNGYADSLKAPVGPLSFLVRESREIRDFQVHVSPENALMKVDASWRLPENSSSNVSYVLRYIPMGYGVRPLNGVSRQTLLTIPGDSVSGTVFETTDKSLQWEAGKGYQFWLEMRSASDLVLTSTSLDVLSVAQANYTSRVVADLDRTLSLGDSSSQGVRLALNPKEALERNVDVTVSRQDSQTLLEQSGGGKRLSEVIQLGPDGLEFKSPVDAEFLFEAPTGKTLADVAPSCSSLDAKCEEDLLSRLNVLYFDSDASRWSMRGSVKTRVETMAGDFAQTKAVLHSKLFHFSSYIVASSLVIDSPANQSSLQSALIGTHTYSDFVTMSGTITEQDVAVSFQPADTHLSWRIDPSNSSRVEIYLPTGLTMVNPTSASQVAVTVTVTDQASSTSDTRNYVIPVVDTQGSTEYTGVPRNVDWLGAKITALTGDVVNLSWSLETDDNNGLQVHTVVLESRRIYPSVSQTQTATFMRNQTSYSMSGLGANEHWEFRMYTRSYNQVRSSAANDIVRYTYGRPENIVNGATQNINSQSFAMNDGKTVGTLTINPLGGEVGWYKFSDSDITSGSGTAVMFNSAQTLSNGAVFYPETAFDFNFSATKGTVTAPASVSYTTSVSGSQLGVYHYNTATRTWSLLGSSSSGGLWAELSTVSNGTRVTIKSSLGAGSPFALGVVPTQTVDRSGGGGGCSVSGLSTSHNDGIELMNLILMFLPLTILMLLKRR